MASEQQKALLQGPDGPDAAGLREFSVVYTDRALNHMSGSFGDVVRDIDSTLSELSRRNTAALLFNFYTSYRSTRKRRHTPQ
jgi:hypothetical protein